MEDKIKDLELLLELTMKEFEEDLQKESAERVAYKEGYINGLRVAIEYLQGEEE